MVQDLEAVFYRDELEASLEVFDDLPFARASFLREVVTALSNSNWERSNPGSLGMVAQNLCRHAHVEENVCLELPSPQMEGVVEEILSHDHSAGVVISGLIHQDPWVQNTMVESVRALLRSERRHDIRSRIIRAGFTPSHFVEAPCEILHSDAIAKAIGTLVAEVDIELEELREVY